ncbi:MAG: hypothetical protein CM15mP74_27870 [Halieaceae bacterium]|nr:MAG: hypothetical protein CM15mP74_27870 [Halieaceae bacterium]
MRSWRLLMRAWLMWPRWVTRSCIEMSSPRLSSLTTWPMRGARLPASVPMGYVDAYYEFEDRPGHDACDVILSNCYPFWGGCAPPYAILYIQDMYRRLQKWRGQAHHHY